MSITGTVYWNMPRCLLHLLQSNLSKCLAQQVTRQVLGSQDSPAIPFPPQNFRSVQREPENVDGIHNEWSFQGCRETQPLPLWAHPKCSCNWLIAAGQQVMWGRAKNQSKTRSWTHKPSIISKQPPAHSSTNHMTLSGNWVSLEVLQRCPSGDYCSLLYARMTAVLLRCSGQSFSQNTILHFQILIHPLLPHSIYLIALKPSCIFLALDGSMFNLFDKLVCFHSKGILSLIIVWCWEVTQ